MPDDIVRHDARCWDRLERNAAALAHARAVAPHLGALADLLLPRLPGGVLCSNNLKSKTERPTSYRRPGDVAIKYQWMALNSTGWTNAITVDCDHAGWFELLEAMLSVGLPEPTFVCVSPWKGSAHLVWLLDRPGPTASPKYACTLRAVRRGLTLALDGDPRFVNRLQKNPWAVGTDPGGEGRPANALLWNAYEAAQTGLIYHTISREEPRPISVGELLTPLLAWATDQRITLFSSERAGSPPRPARHVPAGNGAARDGQHGSRLFDAARMTVYRRCTADPDVIEVIVREKAACLGSPASERDISSIAASITRFMRERWTGPIDGVMRHGRERDFDAGVMTREAVAEDRLAKWHALGFAQRRQAAGRRSRCMVADKTNRRLAESALAMLTEGLAITQVALAARAGVSVRTVKGRWHDVGVFKGRVQHGLILFCPLGGSKPTTLGELAKAYPVAPTMPTAEATEVARTSSQSAEGEWRDQHPQNHRSAHDNRRALAHRRARGEARVAMRLARTSPFAVQLWLAERKWPSRAVLP